MQCQGTKPSKLTASPDEISQAAIAQQLGTLVPIVGTELHLLFQFNIWILVREPAQGKVVFKEKDWLIKAVFG